MLGRSNPARGLHGAIDAMHTPMPARATLVGMCSMLGRRLAGSSELDGEQLGVEGMGGSQQGVGPGVRGGLPFTNQVDPQP